MIKITTNLNETFVGPGITKPSFSIAKWILVLNDPNKVTFFHSKIQIIVGTVAILEYCIVNGILEMW